MTSSTPQLPTLDNGTLFLDAMDTSGATIWERVTAPIEKIRLGDYVGDMEIRGISAAKHDEKEATRFELVQYGETGIRDARHGRLVVQNGGELTVERVWDPKKSETSVTVTVSASNATDYAGMWLLNYVFRLVQGTRVSPTVVSTKGDPQVTLTGLRTELAKVLHRFDPEKYPDTDKVFDNLMPKSANGVSTWDLSSTMGLDPLDALTIAVGFGLHLGIKPGHDLFTGPLATGTEEQMREYLDGDESVTNIDEWLVANYVPNPHEASTLESVEETPGQAYPQLPWQKAATEKALGDRTWRPVKKTMGYLGAGKRNPWNQSVWEGWELAPTSGDLTDRIYVGRQFMRLLFANYEKQLDLRSGITV